MSTTKFQIDLHFQPMNTAEAILGTLYANSSDAIEQHNLVNSFCNIFIPVSKKVTVFAEVQIDAITTDVVYFVTSSKNTAKRIPALSYNQAIRELRTLLV